MAPMEWTRINVPALERMRSTEARQLLPRHEWPAWARAARTFSAACLTPLGCPPALSTGTLSTGNVQASIDFERQSKTGPPFRYYRFWYVSVVDGRLFQSEQIKDVEYGHHRTHRPEWLAS
jgi:hypothetical protein